MIIKSKIEDFKLNNKIVFFRVDLNTDIINGKIINDFKLKAIIPTLNLLISKKAKIILATHLARPKDHNPKFSTKIFLKYFNDLEYKIKFYKLEELLENKNILENLKKQEIILLENLRFYKYEKYNAKFLKKDIISFAKKLRSLSDFYISDAFGSIHRKDTSLYILPKLYDKNHKSIGLLIEKEINILNKLKNSSQKPFLIILGGGKVKDKLPLIKKLINIADYILLCPALVFTFLKAQNINIAKSMTEDSLLDLALNILKIAQDKLIFPIDYQIIINKNIKYTKDSVFPENSIGASIGPKTIELFKNKIENAGTIFINSRMGFDNIAQTLTAFKDLIEIIGKSKAYKVAGGGDSVATIYKYNLENNLDFCSTGGGATLTFLISKNLAQLSGLKNIIDS